jgi:hypothetical protein
MSPRLVAVSRTAEKAETPCCGSVGVADVMAMKRKGRIRRTDFLRWILLRSG